MRTERRRQTGERVAVTGLVLLACTSATADDALRDIVRTLYADRSYVLIEVPGSAPRLLLLSTGDRAALPEEEDSLAAALEELGSSDPVIRERAVLALDDLAADPTLLAPLLFDPSPEVRDTVAAVLESRAERDR